MSTTHYDMLKISPDASPEIVRAAYKALAHKYHPDKNIGNDEALKLMQHINLAYNTLGNPQKRLEYDARVIAPYKKAKAAQPAQAQNDHISSEARAWSNVAAKATQEAIAARQTAEKASAQAAAKAGIPMEAAKWQAWADKSAQDAADAEKRAAEATAKASAMIEKSLNSGQGGNAAAPGATHYETLKIAPDAPAEVIRAAYKALAQTYSNEHGLATAEDARALEIINIAYKTLSSDTQRAAYDAQLKKHGHQQQASAEATAQTASEKDLDDKVAKTATQSEAAAKWAASTAAQAKEAAQKADEANKQALEKATDKDAAKWANWADKLAADAKIARDVAIKAAKAAQEKAAIAAAAKHDQEANKRMADEKRDAWSAAEKK